MRAHVLRGTRQEIAEQLAAINGELLEVIVLVSEPSLESLQSATVESDIFAEMRPYMDEGSDDIDDSYEAIYRRMPGE